MASVWNQVKKLGVVISQYDSSDHYHIQVVVGDCVHIIEEDEAWYRCILIRDRTVKGILPKAYVHVKECTPLHIGNYETVVPKELPVVLEVTSVLREWWPLLKKLYMVSEKSKFLKIRKMMVDLISLRRELMSTKLTLDESRTKQLKATSTIDQGNLVLELDLTVRDEQGEIIKADVISTVELYREHQRTVEMHNEQASKPSHMNGLDSNRSSLRQTRNLYVSVRNVICKCTDEVDVIVALYDALTNQIFSENYVIRWGGKGLPKDLDTLNNLRALFTDLGSKDLRARRPHVFLVCQIVRLGGMFPPQDIDAKPVAPRHMMRRPFGVAALNVTEILNGQISADEDKQNFVPIIPCSDKTSLDAVLKDAVKGEEVTQRIHKGQGIWVNVRLLDGDQKQVKEDYPHLIINPTVMARKMGFPEVIMPSDVRNDFYVTLNFGKFSPDSTKISNRNIEVCMQVCSRDGKPLEAVVSVGGGAAIQSEYKSVVYRHMDSPTWNETFKIAVPTDEIRNCHLKFVYKHRSASDNKDKTDKEFAMSHVSFTSFDQTTLEDGEHNLLVYAFDPKKSSDALSYISLPALTSELEREKEKWGKVVAKGPYTLSRKDTFNITTLACSTQLTHNAHLLGLLNWKAQEAKVPVHLRQLMSVDGEEIVKFLRDTLDALFAILNDQHSSDSYDKMVFNALIFVVGLIGERNFVQFKPVLEFYINEKFSAPLAYNKLMVVLKYYIDTVDQEDIREQLYKVFRSINYLLKFIIKSRQMYSGLNGNRGQQHFEHSMKQIFQSINNMMCDSSSATLKIQGAALKFLPAVIPDLVDGENQFMDRVELGEILTRFISNVPRERLSTQKLSCIQDIVNSPLFFQPDSRQIVMQMLVEHTRIEINDRLDANDAKKTNLSLCANIIADVLNHMYTHPETANDITFLFVPVDLLRTVMRAVIHLDGHSKERQEYVVILISVLNQMSEDHYALYQAMIPEATHNSLHNLADFLAEILMVFSDLINTCVFDIYWNEMIMVQNKIILKALRCFSHKIKERFSNPFNSQLWSNFFHCAVSFLSQDALQLEQFSTDKSRKIIARYGDMRREMGFEIRDMWFNLGGHKIKFIPNLVGKFLEMTFIPETELQKATLPIFFDMMQCEFNADQEGTFSKFENELITQMDVQVESGSGDNKYKEQFYKIIRERCSNHQTMKEAGLRFVEVIRKLLTHLLEYRDIVPDESADNRMNCIVNLLGFYHSISRQEMYVRYLHKLYSLHLDSNSFTEAAYTLLRYSQLLQWSDDELDPILRSDLFRECHTHRMLKEQLYNKIIQLFDKGMMWEKAIEICKQLISQYEDVYVEYEKLPRLLATISECYGNILTANRQPREYYRVGYYGNGFPSFLSNKVFVYRGSDFEMLGDFSRKIQDQFPNARVMQTLNEPGIEITESTGQYLQISRVDAQYERLPKFASKHVTEKVLKYYKYNEINTFTHTKRVSHSDDVTKLWLDRTTLRISSKLPGILRWFQVVEERRAKVSPLENAVETMAAANEKLRILLEGCENERSIQINPLSMQLNGIIDPAVNGGIILYKPFYKGTHLVHEQNYQGSITDQQLVNRLKQETSDQLYLLSRGLDIHNRHVPDALRAFNDKLIDSFDKMITIAQTECGVQAPEDMISVQPKSVLSQLPRASRMNDLDTPTANRKTSQPDREKISRASSLTLFGNNKGIIREKSPSKASLNKSAARNSGRVSNYSTDSKDSGDSNEKKSTDSGPVVELTQQITNARPYRSDAAKKTPKNRPASGKPKQKSCASDVKNLTQVYNSLDAPADSKCLSNNAGLSPLANQIKPSNQYNPMLGDLSEVASPDQSPRSTRAMSTTFSATPSRPRAMSVQPESSRSCHGALSVSNQPQAYTVSGAMGPKWGSAGSIIRNGSFDEQSIQMSSSPLFQGQYMSPHAPAKPVAPSNGAFASVPPPLPNKEKGSHSDYSNLSMDDKFAAPSRVTLRQHSHKGKPPASLPTHASGEAEPPPIPVKRSSQAGRQTSNNTSSKM